LWRTFNTISNSPLQKYRKRKISKINKRIDRLYDEVNKTASFLAAYAASHPEELGRANEIMNDLVHHEHTRYFTADEFREVRKEFRIK
jgi:vacuolar-type H+-ATPase subunit I/STV1